MSVFRTAACQPTWSLGDWPMHLANSCGQSVPRYMHPGWHSDLIKDFGKMICNFDYCESKAWMEICFMQVEDLINERCLHCFRMEDFIGFCKSHLSYISLSLHKCAWCFLIMSEWCDLFSGTFSCCQESLRGPMLPTLRSMFSRNAILSWGLYLIQIQKMMRSKRSRYFRKFHLKDAKNKRTRGTRKMRSLWAGTWKPKP